MSKNKNSDQKIDSEAKETQSEWAVTDSGVPLPELCVSSNFKEEFIPVKATVLQDFSVRIPMQGHQSTVCTVNFKRDDEITDPYVLEVLRTTEKPLRFI